MTFISRKSRSFVSRWLDGSDGEYRLRASRKRSEGRLKRHTSCDDFRAWISNNCIKNEYLLELMSDGESEFASSIRLYGRFIPVPTLFKILRDTEKVEADVSDTMLQEPLKTNTETDLESGAGQTVDLFRESFVTENLRKEGSDKSIVRGKADKNVSTSSLERWLFREPEEFYEEEIVDKEYGMSESLPECLPKRPPKCPSARPIEHLTQRSCESGTQIEIANHRSSKSKCLELKESQRFLVEDNLFSKERPDKRILKQGVSDDTVKGGHAFLKILCEKYYLEKRLFECTSLLCRAIGKLERIETMVSEFNEPEGERSASLNSVREKRLSRCTDIPYTTISTVKASLRKIQNNPHCKELLKKITTLEEQLLKTQQYRKYVENQIYSSQVRAGKCASTLQVTQLYNRREKAHLRKLQKKMEKVVSERGRLLNEMCNTLKCLNNLKRCSEISVDGTDSRSDRGTKLMSFPVTPISLKYKDPSSFRYRYDDTETSGSERVNSEYLTSDESATGGMDVDEGASYTIQSVDRRRSLGMRFSSSGSTRTIIEHKTRSRSKSQVASSSSGLYGRDKSAPRRTQVETGSLNEIRQNKSSSKPKLKFIQDKGASPDSYFPKFVYCKQTPSAEIPIRPWSTPEKTRQRSESVSPKGIPGRKVKSETTMKEIEKALRNYEQRLRSLNDIEFKVETLKQKFLEADRFKNKWARYRAELRRLRLRDSKRSCKEISRLCSENAELKKQIQDMTTKFETQCKRYEVLGKRRVTELEGQSQQLTTELDQYQSKCEDQQKCIRHLEGIIKGQKMEIEKLMCFIRKLSALQQERQQQQQQMQLSLQQRSLPITSTHRSRSCGPKSSKLKNMRYRLKSQTSKTPDDEQLACVCEEISSRPWTSHPESSRAFIRDNSSDKKIIRDWGYRKN